MLPADLPRSLAYESEPSFDKRKAQIHEIEAKIRDEPRVKQLQLPVQRLDWALDRVIYYVASRDGMLPEVHLNDLIAALKGEEERARSRDLVDRLQPLYYATECIDERLPEEVDKLSASRLLEVIGEIEHFLNDHTGRDSRGKIRRRLASIRRKLGER